MVYRESLAIGSPVSNVRATDADAGDNGRVTYSLKSSSSAVFRVDPDTGVVSLRAGLDREQSSRHTVTVVATDNAVPSRRMSAEAVVNVVVEDDNDNVPAFSKRRQGRQAKIWMNVT